ncbi:MRPS9 [Auxenochlorella protothecoides x Auxenochlorella symbiontica]
MSRAAHLLRRVASQIVQVSNTVGTVGTLIEVKAGCAWAAPSLASRFQLGARGFAAASDGGSRGTGTGSVPPTSSRSVESGDQDEWGSAIITGDWDRAWEIFETTYPVEGDNMPGVLEIMALDSEAEEKAARRQRELDLQEEAAASHVRVVDHLGRSQATGKRKTSIARVWIWEGQGHMMVNKQPYDQYFKTLPRRNDVITPFAVTNTLGSFDVMVNVIGGGTTGQSQAVRHGIAKALQFFDPAHRPELKSAGLLTRDARVVERKKPGRKKARKAFQWVKR